MTKTLTPHESIDRQIWGFSIAAVVLVVLGLAAAGWGIWRLWPLSSTNAAALGGYMSGTVASTWALAGVALIYAALLAQRRQLLFQADELEHNRNELALTRAELEGQKNQLTLQNKTLTRQRFENTFFQLLQLHQENVHNTTVRSGDTDVSGRGAFVELYDHLRKAFVQATNQNRPEPVQWAYSEFFLHHQAYLGHYFRTLYNIVKFIDRSELTRDDKHFYIRLLRAQLSSHELLLLFYNGVSPWGVEKFNPLMREYRLLKNMTVGSLLASTHASLYPDGTFSRSD